MEIKYKYYNCFLEHTNFKDDLIGYKYSCCNKNNQQKLDKNLKDRFSNTYKHSNHENNKFILLLRTGIYCYEYMNDWGKFNETFRFNSHLNMEDITDADHVHRKRVCKEYEIKNLVEYHDLYVQSDTLC